MKLTVYDETNQEWLMHSDKVSRGVMMKKLIGFFVAGAIAASIFAAIQAAPKRDGDGGMEAQFRSHRTAMRVSIDIKPSSNPNQIDLDSAGVIGVAMLTTRKFNAPQEIIPESVRFAGATPIGWSLQDVGVSSALPSEAAAQQPDGGIDLLLFFDKQDLHMGQGDRTATLWAWTEARNRVYGTDNIKIKLPKKPKKTK